MLAENFAGNVILDASAAIGGSNFNGGTQNATAAGGTASFTNLALNDAADGYMILASASSSGSDHHRDEQKLQRHCHASGGVGGVECACR